MLRSFAEAEGILYRETLTGFKWICNESCRLADEGYDVVFAFEEAIGFCCGNLVRDKDGVAAAAVFAEMAGQLQREGKTVADQMQSLYDKYGNFVMIQGYVVVPDPSLTVGIFDKVRTSNNGKYPTKIGDFEVAGTRDLTTGFDSSTPDEKTVLPASTSSQHLTFTFTNGAVADLRGSGTEPKLKYYIEHSGPDRTQVVEELRSLVTSVVTECLKPEENGLTWGGLPDP